MSEIYVIAHNIRSAHNIGSLFRTAEGLGIDKIIVSGYSPYPLTNPDERLPHISRKVHDRISKTALGTEELVDWQYASQIEPVIEQLRADGFKLLALEQAPNSISLPDINNHLSNHLKLDDRSDQMKLVLLLGTEVEGISPELLKLADYCIEIPMYGHKESYNVIEAATMAMYQLRLANK